MTNSTIAASWQRIEAWLQENAPHIYDSLQPGASEAEIAKVESQLGVALPDDVKASYRIHNGQNDKAVNGMFPAPPSRYSGFEPGYLLHEVMGIYGEWDEWKELVEGGDFDGEKSEPQPGIRDDWFHLGWLPFAHNGGGDSYCIDLDPAPGGTRGQIISMNHEIGERRLIAPSFADWLYQLANRMEAGRCIIEKGDVSMKGDNDDE
jgi:cell wall assembly regulator SMI1